MSKVADFETTTDVDDCRVWAYAVEDIEDETTVKIGNSIGGFMDYLLSNPDTYYFHNLKFDGEFILTWLFKNGYHYEANRKNIGPDSFNTLISDMGVFYAIELLSYKGENIRILDSLKILPLKVKEIADAFKLPISKLEIDYNESRPVGHILTKEEIDYVTNDVKIVAKALKQQFSIGLTKMTQGSNALDDYKDIVGRKTFKKLYPQLPYEVDKDIRQSYKGGWVYVNPDYVGKDIGPGAVYDVNSLYPWVMSDCLLPYGEPVAFKGKYQYDNAYPLYVQMFTCNFELREGCLPTIQLRRNPFGFAMNEYIKSSEGHDVTLCLTSVDLKLFMDHYEVYNVEFHSGWKFKGSKKLFKDYVNKWFEVKTQATVDKNPGLRKIAKLMLNALYGKFALNPDVQSKIPYYDGRIHYKLGPEERRESLYIPIGTFITSYARNKTIRSAQAVGSRFRYADTDSLHVEGLEPIRCIEVDHTKLGAWDREAEFTRARFVGQKCYIEEIDDELHVTCAGLPSNCYDQVTWDNFRANAVYTGKLTPKHVDGGIVLTPHTHTIKG